MAGTDRHDIDSRPAAEDELSRGRNAYASHAWNEAYVALARADEALPLEAEDLDRLALSAYLIGRDDDYLKALERAYHSRAARQERTHACRCAFWLALRLLFRGEVGRSTGWIVRAERLIERAPGDCVERGYLLLIAAFHQLESGDSEAAYSTAMHAAEIGERCKEADLSVCARHFQGRARLEQRQIAQGLALLDEAMLTVVAGETSPIMTGLVYCSVIESCLNVYALTRSREWTTALAQWCEAQPELISFTGTCLVHRAEIMQFHGAWDDAFDEARRAGERCLAAANRRVAGAAFYQQAEVHRLQGRFVEAEEAYRRANDGGWDPQPGLALLRTAQQRSDVAIAALERALQARKHWLERAKLLPAYIEILLAADEIARARAACGELEQIAATLIADAPQALASQARGAVELASGNARGALNFLKSASELWQRIDAPYLTARTRLLMSQACRAVGDEDGAEFEMAAARAILERLGALPDLTRIDALAARTDCGQRHGLTSRELQVLRTVAEGKTNRAIAAELCLSEKTIDRHLSNIFSKLGVGSRTAAAAYAYRHKLI
jgi:DNA-binding CsgD family transcriptional regulator